MNTTCASCWLSSSVAAPGDFRRATATGTRASIYVCPLAAYLSLSPIADVIEAPLRDDLDLSGWDLRKALGLAVKSNAVVLEWLGSPIVYQHDAAACAVIAGLARSAAHLSALAYHYDRLARHHWVPDAAQVTVLRATPRPRAALDARAWDAAADGPAGANGGSGFSLQGGS